MKKLIYCFLLLIPQVVLADDQEFTGGIGLSEPFSMQVQMCALREGVKQADYDELIRDYFDWSVKHEVEVTFVRQVPLFTHDNLSKPNPYDFVEFLATSFETQGKGWDKWLNTPDGQKLNERWQKLAHCDVKMANEFMLWADFEQMNSDNERVVVWNWCDRNPGVTWEQMNLKHRDMLQNRSEDRSNIGWALFFPHFGGANAPSEFAHGIVYPDVESLMNDAGNYASGGWRFSEDYRNAYASCQGRYVMAETIMRRPGD